MRRASAVGPLSYLQFVIVLLILATGFYLRFYTARFTIVDQPIRGDAREYVAYAWNLKHFNVYSANTDTINGEVTAPKPDAVRPPLLPLMLQPLLDEQIDARFLFGAAVMQAWIAMLTLAAAMLLAGLLLGPWPALAVGALVALSPHMSIYVAYLLTETLFGACVALGTLAAVLALRADNSCNWQTGWALLSGSMFALSCLARPTLNQWVPCLVLLLLVPGLRKHRHALVALLLGFVLTMAPWWLRNELVLGVMSDGSKMLTTVLHGSYPGLMYDNRPDTFGYPYRFDPNIGAVGSSWSALVAHLADQFAQHPGDMLRWFLYGKLLCFFTWSSGEGWGDFYLYPIVTTPWLNHPFFMVIASLMRGLHAPLMIAGVFGTVLAFLPSTTELWGRARGNALRFVALLHLFAIGVHIIGFPISRYSVPFRPLTFVLAIFALLWLYQRYTAHRQSSDGEAVTATA